METTQARVSDVHGYEVIPRLRPLKRFMKNVPRRVARVKPALMATFDQLCDGKLRWPLFIHGDTGTGKTLAALCMHDVLDDCPWTNLEGCCKHLVTYNEWWWTRIGEAPCAIFDEIGGRDNVTSVDADAVKKFLDLRELQANRVGIYISNHNPTRIKELYGRRIASRMLCGQIFELTGEDLRKTAR